MHHIDADWASGYIAWRQLYKNVTSDIVQILDATSQKTTLRVGIHQNSLSVDSNIYSITDKLNNVKPSLKFTHELEYNCTLPFLDILLIMNINKLEFKVYRKTTCKNDHIHATTTILKAVSS